MERTERVELYLDRDLTVEEALDVGLTLQDATDVLSILQMQLELDRATADPPVKWRPLVDAALRRMLRDG